METLNVLLAFSEIALEIVCQVVGVILVTAFGCCVIGGIYLLWRDKDK